MNTIMSVLLFLSVSKEAWLNKADVKLIRKSVIWYINMLMASIYWVLISKII